MTTFDDDDIEFDFFDEPETAEATQRRRLPRLERPRPREPGDGPPRGPVTGITPLMRLVGLVALMIFVVVVLVFWVKSCQGASKNSAYSSYMEHVTTIAQESANTGKQFSNAITTPGTKTTTLAAKVRGFAQQAQGQAADAQALRPPGPLRPEQGHLVDTLLLRANGLARFADALSQSAGVKDASKAAPKLVAQGQLLSASDVNWEVFFHDPSVDVLKQQNVTGVLVPHSQFLTNPALVGPDAMVRLYQTLHGTSGGAAAPTTGLHGDGIVSVKALPAGTQLSTTTTTTITSSTQLAFAVAVQNSGNSQELGVPVTLTIQGATPIVRQQKIDLISPGETKTLTFGNLPSNLPFAVPVKLKVEVGAVPGEKNLSNNSYTYPIILSVG